MAKDGTNRGGRRVRAGDKPLPLIDKIAAGKAARILEPANLRSEELLEPAELTGRDLTAAALGLQVQARASRRPGHLPRG